MGVALLAGKRALITGADSYMEPAIARRFADDGAEVIEDKGSYDLDPDEPQRVVTAAGDIDILVLNLPGMNGMRQKEAMLFPAQEVDEERWHMIFGLNVHPTMRFVRAVLPQMIERQRGKIIAVTSAAALRPLANASAYSSARAAQHAYLRAVDVEMAAHNIQINAIAQNWTIGGFPENAMDIPEIREMVLAHVPAQRLAEGWEQAALAAFLASDQSNFFCGQIFPFTGGWD